MGSKRTRLFEITFIVIAVFIAIFIVNYFFYVLPQPFGFQLLIELLLLLIIILTIVFFLTIFLLWRQKKISEIIGDAE